MAEEVNNVSNTIYLATVKDFVIKKLVIFNVINIIFCLIPAVYMVFYCIYERNLGFLTVGAFYFLIFLTALIRSLFIWHPRRKTVLLHYAHITGLQPFNTIQSMENAYDGEGVTIGRQITESKDYKLIIEGSVYIF